MKDTQRLKNGAALRRGIRWWPAAGILLAEAILLGCLWLLPDIMRQTRVLSTYASILLTVVLLSLWALVGARLRLVPAVLLALAPYAIGAALMFAVRIDGVTGDFLLQWSWKWTPPPEERELERMSAASVEAAGEVAPRMPSESDARRIARDYPQFLGHDRDAMIDGLQLARDWETRPPRVVWEISVGSGWSSFAVAGNRAVTQEQRGKDEVVACYDLQTGRPLWAHGDAVAYRSPIAGDGPRATPTISGERIYTMGSTGLLQCLRLVDGQQVWSRNVLEENGLVLAEETEWGKACSPLVDGDRVIVSVGARPGRSLIAYDRLDGREIWAHGDGRSSYSSPRIATLAGQRQIVILNKSSVAGHDADSGEVLWTYPWPGTHPSVAQPVPIDQTQLFVAAGYGVGGKLLRIQRKGNGDESGLAAELVWENRHMRPKFTNVVLADGKLYGLSDGILLCQDAATGERLWKGGRYGHGQLLLVSDLLLVQTEDGDLVLVEARPDRHEEIARHPVFDRKSWNTPALAGDFILLRNDEKATCLQLPVTGAQ